MPWSDPWFWLGLLGYGLVLGALVYLFVRACVGASKVRWDDAGRRRDALESREDERLGL